MLRVFFCSDNPTLLTPDPYRRLYYVRLMLKPKRNILLALKIFNRISPCARKFRLNCSSTQEYAPRWLSSHPRQRHYLIFEFFCNEIFEQNSPFCLIRSFIGETEINELRSKGRWEMAIRVSPTPAKGAGAILAP